MQAVVESKLHYPLTIFAPEPTVIKEMQMFHMKQLNSHFL